MPIYSGVTRKRNTSKYEENRDISNSWFFFLDHFGVALYMTFVVKPALMQPPVLFSSIP